MKNKTAPAPEIHGGAPISRMHLHFCETFPGVAEPLNRARRTRNSAEVWIHLRAGWEAVAAYAAQRAAEARAEGGAT